jgi:APA family basic amino acid/polyamine antiporter
VGTGIFVLTGEAAADHAGPAVVLSFVVAVRHPLLSDEASRPLALTIR